MSDYSDSYSEGYEQENYMINHCYESYTMPDLFNRDNQLLACDLKNEAFFLKNYEPAFWLICRGNGDDEAFYLVLMMVNHNGNLVQVHDRMRTRDENEDLYMDIRTKKQINDLIGTTYYGG